MQICRIKTDPTGTDRPKDGTYLDHIDVWSVSVDKNPELYLELVNKTIDTQHFVRHERPLIHNLRVSS